MDEPIALQRTYEVTGRRRRFLPALRARRDSFQHDDETYQTIALDPDYYVGLGSRVYPNGYRSKLRGALGRAYYVGSG